MPRAPEEKLLDLIRKAQEGMKIKKEVRVFSRLNIFLGIVIFFILVIFLVDLIRSHREFRQFKDEIDAIEVPAVLPLADDIVSPKIDVEESEPAPEAHGKVLEKADSGKDLISSLTLLGVVSGDKDQAIIKDSNSGDTYFLYEGESIKGCKVMDISDSGVTLQVGETTYKLRL